MRTYKLVLKPELPTYLAASIERRFRQSGIVVTAVDERGAREFAAAKTGMAVQRSPDGLIPQNAWLTEETSFCFEIGGPVPQPSQIVAGNEIAPLYLDDDQRQSGSNGERIVWWPCSPHDRCPV
jgi:hypothetical protein